MAHDIKYVISSGQCRAGRALLGWSQDDLERESKVAKKTIADFERAARQPYARTLADIRDALEGGGVVFIDENGEGEGVRRRKLRVGDTVRFRPQSQLRHGYKIDLDEVGEVIDVELRPTITDPTYRVSVSFPPTQDRDKRDAIGVLQFEFVLVKGIKC